jgi:3-hydroxyisobutyrate dehydrogenase-like beta-hydroxyacid dehydrogenase
MSSDTPQGDRYVGFVGLGTMGGAMVEALLGGGHRVSVYDLDEDATATAESLGARRSSSVAELARKSEVVFTSLPDSQAVRDVYLGDDGMVAAARPRTVLVELSTIDPSTVIEVERHAERRGITLLDAPVSGSPDEARRGELFLIVGGDPEALESVRSTLECFGHNIHHVESVGAAKTVKLVNNMMTMGNVLVAAEAFAVGLKAGIEADVLFSILSRSGGRSHHFVKRFPKALDRNFEPGFSIRLGEKDLSLALDLARGLGVPVPTTALVQQMYRTAMSEGLAAEDIVAVSKVFEGWGGVSSESATGRNGHPDAAEEERIKHDRT